jgi:hypothetical protein
MAGPHILLPNNKVFAKKATNLSSAILNDIIQNFHPLALIVHLLLMMRNRVVQK